MKGPEETGFLLKSESRSETGGVSFRICSGRIGKFRATLKSAYGDGRVKTAVLSFDFSTFTPLKFEEYTVETDGSFMRFAVKITSSMVRGVPSDHFRLSFRVTVQTLPESSTEMDFARARPIWPE